VDDRRIRVATSARATIRDERRSILVVGVSARTALFVTDQEAGLTGSTLTLFLPTTAGELELLAGVERVDKVPDGFAVAVAFIVPNRETRTALNGLMALLLAGDGGGARTHPRVIYDVPVRYGPTLSSVGRLEEMSLRGASVRVGERILAGDHLKVSIPEFSTQAQLELEARVVHQRVSKERGYHTGIEFQSVESTLHTRLTRLLADLLCR
jgi:hypothetical protein